MTKMVPWKTGIALALTMAISYIVCAVLYSVWPDRGLDFFNALFHGLDFRKLETATPFRLSLVVYRGQLPELLRETGFASVVPAGRWGMFGFWVAGKQAT